MKLIICGKGGSGKSTIIALLARYYAASGRRVLVVDTDTANAGLHRILGTDAARDLTGFFGGKGGRRRDAPSVGPVMQPMRPPAPPPPGTWTYDRLPAGYFSENGNIRLVSIGKIADAFQFGKGYWTMMALRFLSGLALEGNDIALIDAEAGVEHLERGIAKACDAMIFVVEPSLASLELAATVGRMVAKEDAPLYFVMNKTSAESATLIKNRLFDASRVIGEFPRDPAILDVGLEGRVFPSDYPEASLLARKLAEIETQATFFIPTAHQMSPATEP